MQTTTLSYENIHLHGELFANVFRARKQSFIIQQNWDLPEALGMEYDQYDTPASRWIAVHEHGEVLGGMRLTPTTSRCGLYTYMIRDAQRGLLETIPRNLLNFEAPVDPNIWESSRVFVANEVPASDRLRVQMQLIHEMVVSARNLGATTLLGIIPEHSPRLARRVGLDCIPSGPVMDTGGSKSVCVTISMATKLH